ncbi:MAG TPA: hypothetical protein VIJ87_10635, partial [Pyrinomonadaceae bacterium]
VHSCSTELLGSVRLGDANERCSSTQKPEGADQEIYRIPKKRRLVSFNRVTNKLKHPPNNEKTQSPAPTKNEERQRQNNHRDTDTVRQPIQRMLMFGFVVTKEVLLHVGLNFGLWT